MTSGMLRSPSTAFDDEIAYETRTLRFPDNRPRQITLKPGHWQLYERLVAHGYPKADLHGGPFTTAVYCACENYELIDDLLPGCMVSFMDSLAQFTWQPETSSSAN
jgi:hypothetical protein